MEDYIKAVKWLKLYLKDYVTGDIDDKLYDDFQKALTVSEKPTLRQVMSDSNHFLYNCFIRKHSTELINELRDFGYKFDDSCAKFIYEDDVYTKCIDGVVYLFKKPEYDKLNMIGLDCGMNEKLFLAVAAVRDDNDYKQWFVHEAEHNWVNQGLFIEPGDMYQVYTEFDMCHEFQSHKATVFELVRHKYFTEN